MAYAIQNKASVGWQVWQGSKFYAFYPDHATAMRMVALLNK